MHAFRRDPGDPETGIDWPQTFVAASVVGAAAWGLWFFLRDRSDVMSPGVTTTQSGSVPGEGAAPSPGAAAGVGDVITVPTPLVAGQLGPAHAPNSGVVRLRVTVVEAERPDVVLAVSADPAYPSGAPVIVPRSQILSIASVVVPPPPSSSLPVPAAPAGPVFMVGDPVLTTGQRYRARLQLSGLEATFATKNLIAAKFQSGGFDQVAVFQSPGELPSDWPSSTSQPGSGVWWVEGIWSGPTGTVRREPQIVQVWQR